MKTSEKYEVGKKVAELSEGRIKLAVENGMAVLSGSFTRKDRAPLRFKKGAGWSYRNDGAETWTLHLGKFKPSEPSAKKEAEPSEGCVPVGTIFMKWRSFMSYFFVVTRSSAKSVWLKRLVSNVSHDGPHGQSGHVKPTKRACGKEFRKAWNNGISDMWEWDGKPVEWYGD